MLQSIKTDLVYKKILKKEYTSEQKNWHEESFGRTAIKYSDVWTDTIPQTPPLESTSVIEKISNIYLTKDVTVDSNRAWVYCSELNNLSTRQGDFIEPDRELSQAYYIKLYDSTGKQIFVGDPVGWMFDYANGILTFEKSPSLFVPPFKISAYRYIGVKGRNVKHEVTTLNEAYRGPDNSTENRKITADLGSVEIQPSNDYAPFRIIPSASLPSRDLADGSMITKDGQIFIWDSTREKWLALNRQTITFGSKRADGCFLSLSSFSSHMSGWPALRNGTILGITAQATGGYREKQFSILLNNNPDPIYEFNLQDYYYSNGNLNIDFSSNDLIKILTSSRYATTTGVIVTLEIAWSTR